MASLMHCVVVRIRKGNAGDRRETYSGAEDVAAQYVHWRIEHLLTYRATEALVVLVKWGRGRKVWRKTG
jgi:hypothetical protein